MNYSIFHNLDARCWREWTAGDRLATGLTGSTPNFDLRDIEILLEGIFAIHNAPDRPDGWTAPSLSIGDVVVVGESAWSVGRRGWIPVSIQAADIDPRSWLEATEMWA